MWIIRDGDEVRFIFQTSREGNAGSGGAHHVAPRFNFNRQAVPKNRDKSVGINVTVRFWIDVAANLNCVLPLSLPLCGVLIAPLVECTYVLNKELLPLSLKKLCDSGQQPRRSRSESTLSHNPQSKPVLYRHSFNKRASYIRIRRTTHIESLPLFMAPIPVEARHKALLIGINYDSEGAAGVLEGSHHNVKVLKNLLIGE